MRKEFSSTTHNSRSNLNIFPLTAYDYKENKSSHPQCDGSCCSFNELIWSLSILSSFYASKYSKNSAWCKYQEYWSKNKRFSNKLKQLKINNSKYKRNCSHYKQKWPRIGGFNNVLWEIRSKHVAELT